MAPASPMNLVARSSRMPTARSLVLPLAAIFLCGVLCALACLSPRLVPAEWRPANRRFNQTATKLYVWRGNVAGRGAWFLTAWATNTPQGRYVATSESLSFGWAAAVPPGTKDVDTTEHASEREAADAAAAEIASMVAAQFPVQALEMSTALRRSERPPGRSAASASREDFDAATVGTIVVEHPERRWLAWLIDQRTVVRQSTVYALPLLSIWLALRITDLVAAWKRARTGLCQGCGYQLAGLPVSTRACPECGRARW